MHPFTREELEQAYGLLMSGPETKKLAAPVYDSDSEPKPFDASATLQECRGDNLTEDTLALLSLVSPALQQKVAEYRKRLWRETEPEDYENEWSERVETVKAVVRHSIDQRH